MRSKLLLIVQKVRGARGGGERIKNFKDYKSYQDVYCLSKAAMNYYKNLPVMAHGNERSITY